MPSTTRSLMVGAASVLAAAATLVPGAAAGAATTDVRSAPVVAQDDGARPRVVRACNRIPNLEIRTDLMLTRLNGDETVRGSLIWLQDRVDRARDAGREDLAVVLANRLEVRTATIDVLELRQTNLAEARELCAKHGVTPS